MKTAIGAICGLVAITAFAQAQPSNQMQKDDQNTAASGTAPGATHKQSTPNPSTAQQSGINQMDKKAGVAVTFYRAQPADMRASKLIGAEVYNLNNENIGEVEDLIIDNGRTLKAVVLSVGGFLGLGERNVAVTPDALVLTPRPQQEPKLVLHSTKDELKNAPEFKFADKADRSKASTSTAPDSSANKTTGQSSMQKK